MVGHFWIGRWDGLAWAAGLVGAGVLAHAVNVALSLRGVARWSFTARGIALALGGLVLTVAFGVTLAITHGGPSSRAGSSERRARPLPPGAPRLDRADDPGRVGTRLSDVPRGPGAGSGGARGSSSGAWAGRSHHRRGSPDRARRSRRSRCGRGREGPGGPWRWVERLRPTAEAAATGLGIAFRPHRDGVSGAGGRAGPRLGARHRGPGRARRSRTSSWGWAAGSP